MVTYNPVREKAKALLEMNPKLSYAEIGRILGVSRERIRQLMGPRKRMKEVCKSCGRRIKLGRPGQTRSAYFKGFCPDCWVLEKEKHRLSHYRIFICEVCGNRFARKAGTVNSQLKKGRAVRWCSKRCQGQWLSGRFSHN